MTSSTENPPPFEAHVTELESVEDGKITNVAVYSGRAEVTRTFRFSLKAGQNQVHISGLPNVMDQDSLRVEGRGAGTIQEVSISYIHAPPVTVQEHTPQIQALQDEKEILEQTSYRALQSLKSLDRYIDTLTSTSIPSSQIKEVLAEYNSSAKEYQTETRALRQKMKDIEVKIAEEKKKGQGKERNSALCMKASVGIFAEAEGEVEIGLVYAVMDANWAPKYDIRVNSQSKEKAVTLVYKGSLTQNTGEDWTDVPLVLETATPTFGNEIPELYPWTITVHKPMPPPPPPRLYAQMTGSIGGWAESAPMVPTMAAPISPPGALSPMRDMSIQGAEIAKGGGANVSATFSVPGKMTIPNDGASHNVTIVQLMLDAKMTWVSVPKKDTKVHLSAKIKNTSEFLLLAGSASIYVDGSFISRSHVPSVSPDESFDCPLGLDPAIKVAYHPQTKKLSQSGLINKTDVYLYTQRISVHNTKSIEVENVKLVDQIPVSEDSTVNVKLISPALQLPGSSILDGGSIRHSKGFSLGGGNGKSESSSTPSATKIPAPVKVSKEVIAKWDDGNEEAENVDVNSLGKDGKINFACALPPQGKTNVTLQWEVTAPAKTRLWGL